MGDLFLVTLVGLTSLYDCSGNDDIGNREGRPVRIPISATSASLRDPSNPLRGVEHGSKGFHHLCDIVLGVVTGGGVGYPDTVSVDSHYHPTVTRELSLHGSGSRGPSTTPTTTFVTIAIMVGPRVPGGLAVAVAVVFYDIHFHTLRGVVRLDVAVVGEVGSIRARRVEVVVHSAVCPGGIHLELDVSAKKIERLL